jgi:hypothetical protein
MSREAAICDFLSREGWAGARRAALAGDASARRYERLDLRGQHAVLMDMPPNSGLSPAPFLGVTCWLRGAGFSAPEVLAAAPDLGLVKRHLFRMGGEHRQYDAGVHALIVEWRGARLCPLVCYDLRFPVWSRRRPELEYDVVIYSANWPAARRFAWSALLRARAIENQAYCIGVNRVGDDGNGVAHAGDSVVNDFLGQPLLELDDQAQVKTVALDLEALHAWRDKFPAHLDADAFTLES